MKKRKDSSGIDFTKKFFEEDLNVAFADDATKRLGTFPCPLHPLDYTIHRSFIAATADNEVKLYHSKFTPLSSPLATILVVHGFCEHQGLYINVRIAGTPPLTHLPSTVRRLLREKAI